MFAHNFLRVFFHVFNSEYAERDFPRIESVEDSPLYHLGETVGLKQIAEVLVAVKLIPPPTELSVITSNQKGGQNGGKTTASLAASGKLKADGTPYMTHVEKANKTNSLAGTLKPDGTLYMTLIDRGKSSTGKPRSGGVVSTNLVIRDMETKCGIVLPTNQ